MDESRFDALSRALAMAHSRRGLSRLLSAFALSALLAPRGVEKTLAKRKKRSKKKHRDAGTATACTPQDPTTVCAAGCGMRSDNCGRPVVCPCPTGATCLNNGSCGTTCDPAVVGSCPPQCTCFNSVDGPNRCVETWETCPTDPPCDTNLNCPLGWHCTRTFCGPHGETEKRCLPLCGTPQP